MNNITTARQITVQDIATALLQYPEATAYQVYISLENAKDTTNDISTDMDFIEALLATLDSVTQKNKEYYANDWNTGAIR